MTPAELVTWATDYYPAKATPPPPAQEITQAEIAEVFARLPDRRAQLALMDQAWFRQHVPPSLAKATWERLEYP